MYNLVSFIGMFILVTFAWAVSANRKVVNWRVILWGIALQMLFALFVFVVPVGSKVFLIINNMVVKVLDSATAGTKFLFGRLALAPGTTNEFGEGSLGFILAFQALPTIVFFASLMGLLYYVGIMPKLIGLFSKLFTRLMRISGAESLCAASNIFVGIESSTTIRPYLEKMTASELCTVLTAGMATVASSVLALYVFILQKDFPTIAGHLVSASVLSAPAALVMSKLLMPETGRPVTLGIDVAPHYERESTVMEAIIKGANAGVTLVVGVAALLLALLGITALVDLVLGYAGGGVSSLTGVHLDWSLKGMAGYVLYPFTLVIGVPPSDAWPIAQLIGERVIMTEVKSYQDLAGLLATNGLNDPRSAVIATYALCGFAHIPSLAIFVGGVAALAPSRTTELSRLGFRALLAATLACLMTAAVAGTFYRGGSLLLGN
jgi:CNT family concentrative nucleoside transporter